MPGETDVMERGSAGRRPVVLCVDDERPVLSALARALRGESYRVVTADSAAQALVSLGSLPVRVVISDERMPGKSGSDLLAEVRDRWPGVRRVILTGYLGHPVMTRGLSAGVEFLFQKPWDESDLKQTLRRLIGEVEATRAREADPGGSQDKEEAR